MKNNIKKLAFLALSCALVFSFGFSATACGGNEASENSSVISTDSTAGGGNSVTGGSDSVTGGSDSVTGGSDSVTGGSEIPPETEENSVINGGFETGDLTGWTYSEGKGNGQILGAEAVISDGVWWAEQLPYNQEGNYHFDGWAAKGGEGEEDSYSRARRLRGYQFPDGRADRLRKGV